MTTLDAEERTRAGAKVEANLLTALASIREHWPALLEPTGGGGSTTPSTDIVTALDKRVSFGHELTLHLNGWARIVVEERHLSKGLPLGEDTLGLVTLLERWARWLSTEDAGPECADELSTWAHDLARLVDPPVKEWVHLGDCPFVEQDWFCAGQIRSRIGGDGDASCSDCGRTAPIEWWEDVLKLGIPPCTAGILAKLIGDRLGVRVSDQTIRNWVASGIIAPYDEPQPAPRWTRYDVRAVLDVVSRMGRNCESCGNPWHGQGTICTACFIASRSVARRHAEPKDAYPVVKVPRRLSIVVPDVLDDEKPDRCHFSDLILDQCACGRGGHSEAG